jgi:ferredoxin
MKRPEVDLSECILCGVCEDACPAVFRINDAGFVQVIEHDVYPETDVDEAIRNCPVDCIGWQED